MADRCRPIIVGSVIARMRLEQHDQQLAAHRAATAQAEAMTAALSTPIVTVSVLADLLNVSERTIKDRADAAGILRMKGGHGSAFIVREDLESLWDTFSSDPDVSPGFTALGGSGPLRPGRAGSVDIEAIAEGRAKTGRSKPGRPANNVTSIRGRAAR